MDAFGLLPSDYEETIEVWPENESALELFSAMGTQWRMGFAGPTGLDYVVLLALLDRLDLGRSVRDRLFDDVRVMEVEALAVMRKSSTVQ